jgi:hypothetical protein
MCRDEDLVGVADRRAPLGHKMDSVLLLNRHQFEGKIRANGCPSTRLWPPFEILLPNRNWLDWAIFTEIARLGQARLPRLANADPDGRNQLSRMNKSRDYPEAI